MCVLRRGPAGGDFYSPECFRGLKLENESVFFAPGRKKHFVLVGAKNTLAVTGFGTTLRILKNNRLGRKCFCARAQKNTWWAQKTLCLSTFPGHWP